MNATRAILDGVILPLALQNNTELGVGLTNQRVFEGQPVLAAAASALRVA